MHPQTTAAVTSSAQAPSAANVTANTRYAAPQHAKSDLSSKLLFARARNRFGNAARNRSRAAAIEPSAEPAAPSAKSIAPRTFIERIVPTLRAAKTIRRRLNTTREERRQSYMKLDSVTHNLGGATVRLLRAKFIRYGNRPAPLSN